MPMSPLLVILSVLFCNLKLLLLISFLTSKNSINAKPVVFPVIVSIDEVPAALKLFVFPLNSRIFDSHSTVCAGFCLYSSNLASKSFIACSCSLFETLNCSKLLLTSLETAFVFGLNSISLSIVDIYTP